MNNSNCHRCINDAESLDHLFRCGNVDPLWRRLMEENLRDKGQNLTFWDWIHWNLNLNLPNDEKPWNETFAICLWWL